jgi:regulator of protease activity HflC (stomatin/prohibitin superfamily)
VYEYQGAVVFRWGVVHRVSGPGRRWKWPLIERADVWDTYVETLRVDPQSVTTSDGKSVGARVIVKFQVSDVRKYATEIGDHKDALEDFTMGAVRTCVHALTYDALLANPPEAEILELVRKEVNRYGFKVHRITFTDLCLMPSLRLFLGAHHDSKS